MYLSRLLSPCFVIHLTHAGTWQKVEPVPRKCIRSLKAKSAQTIKTSVHSVGFPLPILAKDIYLIINIIIII
jgi:hypothetical protein